MTWNQLQCLKAVEMQQPVPPSVQNVEDTWQVLGRLPVVDIRWRHPHLVQAKSRGLEEGAPPGQEYQVEVQLRRVGGKKGGSGLARVYAPRFPKVPCCQSHCPLLFLISQSVVPLDITYILNFCQELYH